ncbi:MAG: hypothetical protein EOP34_07375 [Rickettsiales bacterium]|nr:MAG: hypothetical protein EOP34_07375 [Rickettsiales bacterium]
MNLNLSGQSVHQNQPMQHFLENNDLIKVVENNLILPESDQIHFAETLYQIEEADKEPVLCRYCGLETACSSNQYGV